MNVRESAGLLLMVEKNVILKTYNNSGRNFANTAKHLNISRSSIWRKLKTANINIHEITNIPFKTFEFKPGFEKIFKKIHLTWYDGSEKLAYELWKKGVCFFPYMCDSSISVDLPFDGRMIINCLGVSTYMEKNMWIQRLKNDEFDLWDEERVQRLLVEVNN